MGFSLSTQQVQEFRDKGYLIADFQLDPEQLETIKSSVYQYYDESFRKNPAVPARIMDAWKLVDEIRQLAVHKNILHSLEQLFGRKARPFQTLNFPMGTCQAPHSDALHFNSMPSGFMAGVWVALEDIDEGNGPLVYFPGSHKLKELVMQDFGLRPIEQDYPEFEKHMRKYVEEINIEPEYGLMKKGYALIWHANLIHGGAPHLDTGRSRHSQVTHYFFENCQYYTPMLSGGKKLALRDPIWIPDQFNAAIAERARVDFFEHDIPPNRSTTVPQRSFFQRVRGRISRFWQ